MGMLVVCAGCVPNLYSGCGYVCNVPIMCRVCAGFGAGRCDWSLEEGED